MKTIVEKVRQGKRITRKDLASGRSQEVGFRLTRDDETGKESYLGRVSVEIDCQNKIDVLMDFETVERLYNSLLSVQG